MTDTKRMKMSETETTDVIDRLTCQRVVSAVLTDEICVVCPNSLVQLGVMPYFRCDIFEQWTSRFVSLFQTTDWLMSASHVPLPKSYWKNDRVLVLTEELLRTFPEGKLVQESNCMFSFKK